MSISFEAILHEIEARKVIKLPQDISKKLPSRGMVMVQGSMNGYPLIVPLEPDGKGSHWFTLNDSFLQESGADIGMTLSFDLEILEEWIEPEIPEDIINAIGDNGLLTVWNSLTTKARWEWLRWIRSTNNSATRQKRIEVACSKLSHGDRRPCCFDSSRCTVPEVSKSGVLKD